MSTVLDRTHDPARGSWVASADGHADFPIQNLPLGIFSPAGLRPRPGVAIGDCIVDLGRVLQAGLLDGDAARAAEAASGGTLNALLALGAGPRRALRQRLSDLLATGADPAAMAPALHPARQCTMRLPTAIGDYTDFYTGIHHATNIGALFRPDAPLLANYKHIPIAYHGRASSVRVSGTPVRRPSGQLKSATSDRPEHAPSRRLDYELELGVWIGRGSELGAPIPIAAAAEHVGGYCLLNDWSARDIQAWEYQPLGPFAAKNFGSTVSPWVITPEALAPFRVGQPPRPAADPSPLPYLWDERDQAEGAMSIELDVFLTTAKMAASGRPPQRLARSSTRHMYWTVAQMITHHTSGGCDLRPGDLLGSGTLSAPDPTGLGSLMEATRNGAAPLHLASGEHRSFLDDGDEVILRAQASRPGAVTIGFGDCRGAVAV